MLLIYGVVRAGGAPPRLTGIAGERLARLEEGRLGAIVGRVRRVPAATPRNFRRYDAVIRTLTERYPALLPVRFGTSVGEEEIGFILRSRRAVLGRALAHVARRRQMTLRVVIPEAAPVARPSVTVSGAEYLRARAAAAAAAQRVPGFEPVRAAVRRWVKDERVEKRGPVASVYHLVAASAARAYASAVTHAAHEAGLRVIVSGPFPPYAFAEPL